MRDKNTFRRISRCFKSYFDGEGHLAQNARLCLILNTIKSAAAVIGDSKERLVELCRVISNAAKTTPSLIPDLAQAKQFQEKLHELSYRETFESLMKAS